MLLAKKQELSHVNQLLKVTSKSTTENKMFEGTAWTDSIDIFPDTSGNIDSHSKDVQVDNVYQKKKSQAFTFINKYPTSLQGKNTSPALQVKCKIDSEAGANVMSFDDYKKVNPSEFDETGNSLVGFSNDRTTLKAYDGKAIQQYGVRAMNCQWDNTIIKPIFHIVEAKGSILLGLPTLRKMGLFQKHPRVFIETRHIHQIQQKENMARCLADGGMSGNNANEQSSVSDAEQVDPEVTEIMDVTEEWVDTENIDSKYLNMQGPKYIHPDSDIRTRISSKGELKEMYPECFFFRYRYI